MSKRFSTAVPYLLLLMLTATIYSRTITYGFIRWDDQGLVSENPNLHPPTLQHIARFWTGPYVGLYTPLPYTLWSAVSVVALNEHGVMNPRWFHALNLLLHLICLATVYSILRFLIALTPSPCTQGEGWGEGSLFPAFFGTLIFALHPLQVEPVAWISGMNNLLAAALSLLAIRFYFVQRRGFYFLATFFYILALLSKPTVVVVPFIVIAIEWLILHRKPYRAGIWFILAIPIILITKMVQPIGTFEPWPAWKRLFIAVDALGFYFQKLILPVNLSIDYARTPQRLWETGAFHFTIPAAVIVMLVLLLLRPKPRFLLAAAVIFCAALLPTLGLIPFGFQEFSTTADRYAYLAMLGPSLAVAWGLSRLPRNASFVVAAIIPIALAALTIHQIAFWQDTQTLTQHTLTLDPGSATANMIRAAELSKSAHPSQAITCYRAALIRIPRDATQHFNLANALRSANQLDQARSEYEMAIQLQPDVRVKALNNLALTYWQTDRARAAAIFNEALQIDPTYAPAITNLRELQKLNP